jgi:protein-S-isoprenylcysteine O-methyltransferase Ste14
VPSWSKIARRVRVPLGFVFAAAYVWLAHPAKASVAIGAPIAVAGLAIRGIASGHVEKNQVLTTSGPYAYTRNPLYLGSIVITAGFVVAARSWWIAIIAIALLVAIYLPVIRSEESYLRSRFAEYEEYSRRVPRLFPRIPVGQRGTRSFSWHLYWKHREYNAAIGVIVMIAILAGKLFWRTP